DEVPCQPREAGRAGDGGCDRVPVRGQWGRHGDGLRHRAPVGAEDRRRDRARRGQLLHVEHHPWRDEPERDGVHELARYAELRTPSGGCFAGHCDWRLPSISELQTIKDPSAPGCEVDGACIDPVFGPTRAFYYWSATSTPANPLGDDYAYIESFGGGF